MNGFVPIFEGNDAITPITRKIMPVIYESRKVTFDQAMKERERFKQNGYRYMAVSGAVDGWVADPRV